MSLSQHNLIVSTVYSQHLRSSVWQSVWHPFYSPAYWTVHCSRTQFQIINISEVLMTHYFWSNALQRKKFTRLNS